MNIIRTNQQYKVKLTDFEGPLDLLLHLIREHKLEIKTVPLASVTSQYLEFLKQLESLDLNLASEFVEVGATLIDIKSRQILPKLKQEEPEDPDQVEANLRARLEEYKLLKEASQELGKQENVNRFYKPPEPLKEIIKYTLDGVDMDALVSAFQRVMFRIEQSSPASVEPRKIRRDRFTVAEKIESVRARLLQESELSFFGLFESDYSKGEVVNTFLALLELLKTGEIKVVQQQLFEDILIKSCNKEGSDVYQYQVVHGISD